MKKSRFTEAQIVSILNEWDAGTAVAELSRRHGVHANTLRLWRSKYGGLEVSELAKLKQYEEETTRMRRIIATQALEIDAMKELISKNGWGLHSVKSGEGLARARVERTGGVSACALSASDDAVPIAPDGK